MSYRSYSLLSAGFGSDNRPGRPVIVTYMPNHDREFFFIIVRRVLLKRYCASRVLHNYSTNVKRLAFARMLILLSFLGSGIGAVQF